MARMEAEKAQRLLGDVAEDKVFWCHDGRVFRNIREMGEGFAAMTDETFAFHSNRDKGDFSNWVTEVIGDTKLARELAGLGRSALDPGSWSEWCNPPGLPCAQSQVR